MKRENYEGYVIDVNPQQLADDGRWTVNVTIERHDDGGVEECTCSASKTYETKDEASLHGFNFARQIIDGKAIGCVAPELILDLRFRAQAGSAR